MAASEAAHLQSDPEKPSHRRSFCCSCLVIDSLDDDATATLQSV
jgi:hypothetical protein